MAPPQESVAVRQVRGVRTTAVRTPRAKTPHKQHGNGRRWESVSRGPGAPPSLYPISQGPRILASGPKLSHAQARSYIRCMPVHIV